MQYRYQLFNDFLSFACEPSYIPTIMSAREVLVTLPTPWVVEQMEVAADSVLPTADEWVWRRFMEMAAYLDRDLTLSLAERAMRHPDAEIRDAGADFRDNPRPPSVKFP
jgi:hypothetical protein